MHSLVCTAVAAVNGTDDDSVSVTALLFFSIAYLIRMAVEDMRLKQDVLDISPLGVWIIDNWIEPEMLTLHLISETSEMRPNPIAQKYFHKLSFVPQ